MPYLHKQAHISGDCRLSLTEELIIIASLTDHKGEIEDKVVYNRSVYLNALMSQQSSTIPSNTGTIVGTEVQLSFRSPARDGLETIWEKWQKMLPQYFQSPWQPNLWHAMVCYERPKAEERVGKSLLKLIATFT